MTRHGWLIWVWVGLVPMTALAGEPNVGQAAPRDAVVLELDRVEPLVQHVAGVLVERVGDTSVIAVLPFADSSGTVEAGGRLLQHSLEKELIRRKLKLVDRDHLDKVLRERDLQLAELNRGQAVQAVGRLAGADVLVIGTLLKMDGRTFASVRAVEVKTTRLLAATEPRALVARPTSGGTPDATVVNPPTEPDPLALHWQLKRLTAGGQVPLDDGARVAGGDAVRLHLRVDRQAWVYVVLLDSAGQLQLLFPSVDIARSNRLAAGKPVTVPGGSSWFVLDELPGREQFFVLAGAEPIDDLDRLIDHLNRSAPVQRIRLGRRAGAGGVDVRVTTVVGGSDEPAAGVSGGAESTVHTVRRIDPKEVLRHLVRRTEVVEQFSLDHR